MRLTVALVPRSITRWNNGSGQTIEGVTPTPFNTERAREIKTMAQGMTPGVAWPENLKDCMTDGEIAYVDALWFHPSGASTWFGQFASILNGR